MSTEHNEYILKPKANMQNVQNLTGDCVYILSKSLTFFYNILLYYQNGSKYGHFVPGNTSQQ